MFPLVAATSCAPPSSQKPWFKRRRNAAFCGLDTPLGGWASRTPVLVSAESLSRASAIFKMDLCYSFKKRLEVMMVN